MDEEQIRELKVKLAEKQTALDTCLKGTGKVCASSRLSPHVTRWKSTSISFADMRSASASPSIDNTSGTPSHVAEGKGAAR